MSYLKAYGNIAVKGRNLAIILGLTVFISGCASLDKQLVSDDTLTRQNAKQKLQALPASKRDALLETLVQQLVNSMQSGEVYLMQSGGGQCKDKLTATDVNTLNTLTDLGPTAKGTVPYLTQIYSKCEASDIREKINKALISIEGTDANGLRSKQAKNKVATLIKEIERIRTVGRVAKFNALTELYKRIIVAIEPLSSTDKAMIPLSPILEPMGSKWPSLVEYAFGGGCPECIEGPTTEFTRIVIALLVKIGPTSISTLQKWLVARSDEGSPETINVIVGALRQIGTPEALTAITVWKDDQARKKEQAAADYRKELKAAIDAGRIEEEATKAKVASIQATKTRERNEIIALEPQEEFRQVLGIFYDSSQSIQGISASHYKRHPYKKGVKYSIYVSPGAFLNMSVYILPTKREGVFYIRLLPEQITNYARSQKISEDQMVDATPGMAEYLGSTSVIDLATGVMQSWVR